MFKANTNRQCEKKKRKVKQTFSLFAYQSFAYQYMVEFVSLFTLLSAVQQDKTSTHLLIFYSTNTMDSSAGAEHTGPNNPH